MEEIPAIWPHEPTTLRNFLSHINTGHPNVIFSLKLERDCQLQFLDVLYNLHLDNPSGYAI
jgi:hypothetical protein